MSDTTTVQAAKDVATQVGKFALKSTAQTAVEVAGAVAILGVVGLAVSKVQERRAKKAAKKAESK